MGMEMNFYYGDEDGIVKPAPASSRCHPYLSQPWLHIFPFLWFHSNVYCISANTNLNFIKSNSLSGTHL